MKHSPITPSDFINSRSYQNEMEKHKPVPRIREEDRWIKDVSEQGSLGVLFALQGMQSRLEGLRIAQRERMIMANRGELGNYRSPSRVINRAVSTTVQPEVEETVDEVVATRHETKARQRRPDTAVPSLGGTAGPSGRGYLRAHHLSGPPLDVDDYPSIKRPNFKDPRIVKVSVPTACSAANVKLKRREIDFVKANAFALDSGWYKAHIKRERLEKEDPAVETAVDNESVSLGTQLTPAEQRTIVLRLNMDRDRWYNELSRLPVSMDTLRVQARKGQIEKRIGDIEDAIELFSRRRVFVQQ